MGLGGQEANSLIVRTWVGSVVAVPWRNHVKQRRASVEGLASRLDHPPPAVVVVGKHTPFGSSRNPSRRDFFSALTPSSRFATLSPNRDGRVTYRIPRAIGYCASTISIRIVSFNAGFTRGCVANTCSCPYSSSYSFTSLVISSNPRFPSLTLCS